MRYTMFSIKSNNVRAGALILCLCLFAYTTSGLRAQEVIFHESEYTTWYIFDIAAYNAYQSNYDDIISVLDRSIPGIMERLGVQIPLPIRVNIEDHDGWLGWAGGGQVGYSDECFKSQSGMDWVRGVIIGEVVNVATGVIASEWPRDWWVNGVWYYPGMVVVDVLAEVEGAAASQKWENDEHYPTYPTYLLFKRLKDENGWEYYQDLFDMVDEDNMNWSRSGFGENPSAIRTNYVIAYMSLILGENMVDAFHDAGVDDADRDVIQAIMEVRQRLVQAEEQGYEVSDAWSAFRNADFLGADQILDELGVSAITAGALHLTPPVSGADRISVYTLRGQNLYTGSILRGDVLASRIGGGMQTVIVTYFRNQTPLFSEKITCVYRHK